MSIANLGKHCINQFFRLLAFCRDRDVNCAKWKSLGLCASPTDKARIYCGVTCDICKYS